MAELIAWLYLSPNRPVNALLILLCPYEFSSCPITSVGGGVLLVLGESNSPRGGRTLRRRGYGFWYYEILDMLFSLRSGATY